MCDYSLMAVPNRLAQEAAKAHLENILANLSAGVLVFDHELQLSIYNHGAQAILGGELESFAASMRDVSGFAKSLG